MKLLLDMNLAPRWVAWLRDANKCSLSDDQETLTCEGFEFVYHRIDD